MNQNLNNQTTLFRFVSLRNPELTNKENQEKRFVFNLDVTQGYFYQQVIDKNNKWEAMLAAANSFSAFNDEKEIAMSYPEHFELSDWITRNRNTFKLKELAEKLNGISPLSSTIEEKLWDNLYYQVLTQKDFYVKEAVMQLLVLQNILKNTEALNEEHFAKQLLTAKVVLPKELFDELALMQYSTIEEEEDNDVPKELEDACLREEARIASANIETILSELNEIEINHRETRDKNYKAKLTQFKEDNEAEMKKKIPVYQQEYDTKLRAIGKFYKDKDISYKDSGVEKGILYENTVLSYDRTERCNKPDVEFPEFTPFKFDEPEEPSTETIKEKLAILTNQVGELNSTSITKLKQSLSSKLQGIGQQVLNNAKTSTRVVVVGGTAMQIDNFVPVADLFKFQICNSNLTNGNVSVFMNILLPKGYKLQKFVYILNNETKTNTSFSSSYSGNVLTLSNMFNNTLPSPTQETISGTITFTNGLKYKFEKNFNSTDAVNGKLTKVEPNRDLSNEKNNDFKPNTFGYRRLGIADYQKVVSKICRYEAGEVAHIENVMARELREKSTKKFQQRQVVETDSQEIEKEKMTDTSSTERFEMQTEIAKVLQQDRQFSADASVSASFGPVSMSAGASFATSVSKQESNTQSINQAKEITQRASERILSRVKNERTVSTTEEFTETNRHLFDNTKGSEHVSGVYRFINAIYKNSIHNYGKRLMYEFMVPQPAKLHQIAMSVISDNNAVVLKKPEDPRETPITIPSNTTATLAGTLAGKRPSSMPSGLLTVGGIVANDGKITDFTKIDENNYKYLAAKYGAKVNEHPKETLKVNKSFAGTKVEDGNKDNPNEMFNETVDIQLPEGYVTKSASLKLFCRRDDERTRHVVSIAFGDKKLYYSYDGGTKFTLTENDLMDRTSDNTYTLTDYKETLSFSYSILNYMSFSIAFSINLKLDDTKKAQWQKETFDAIIEGYERQLDAYNQSLAEQKASGVEILDSNPLFYRQIEQTVLRKNCISYLLPPNNFVRKFGKQMYEGNLITNFKIKLDQQMDDYSSFVKFMEQAFEWELMSYNFYPYYWGYENDWEKLYKFDSDDATFRSFMQAGMARVIVTVRPDFEKAVMHYIATGQIWNGGETPVIDDPLYLSIVDELKEQEYTVEETWETMLPTNLIALQKNGVAIDGAGLPIFEDAEEAITGSNAELGGGNEETNEPE